MEVLLDLRLPPELRSPGLARRSLGALEDRFGAEVVDRLRFLASELVTNSLKHAALRDRDRIALRIFGDETTLRVEVRDPGRRAGRTPRWWARGWSLLHDLDEDQDPGGWGLALVDAMSDRWGLSVDGGTVVWCEISLEAA